MTPTLPTSLAQIEALLREATPGPWEYLGPTSGRPDAEGTLHPFVIGPNGENPVCVMEGDWAGEHADAKLIAALRNTIEPLIADWRRRGGGAGDGAVRDARCRRRGRPVRLQRNAAAVRVLRGGARPPAARG